MSALWTGTPTTIRLEDLDVICSVLDCDVMHLLIREPEKVAARRAAMTADGSESNQADARTSTTVTPRLGRNRSLPPA
jgi:hypothetical protein